MRLLRNSPFFSLLLRGGPFAYLESFAHDPMGDRTLRPGVCARRDELARRLRIFGQDSAFILFEVSCWLVVNLLAVLGVAVALFLVLSGGDLETFFLHLNNLTSRYSDADFGRRAAFEHQVAQAFLVVLLLSLLVRGPLFVGALRRELRNARAQEGGGRP